jgi:hypothetical protein
MQAAAASDVWGEVMRLQSSISTPDITDHVIRLHKHILLPPHPHTLTTDSCTTAAAATTLRCNGSSSMWCMQTPVDQGIIKAAKFSPTHHGRKRMAQLEPKEQQGGCSTHTS